MPRTGGDQTRERIKAIAKELFTTQGFTGTSLREIAERMDFTKAALYYHFRTKDDLLVEVLEPLMADSQRLIEATAPPGDDRDAVIAFLRRYLEEVLVQHKDLMPLLFRDPAVLGHADVGDRVQTLGAGLLELLVLEDSQAARIRAAAAIGALHTATTIDAVDDPDVIATLVAAAAAALESRPD